MHIDIILFWSIVLLVFCFGYFIRRIVDHIKQVRKNNRLFKDEYGKDS